MEENALKGGIYNDSDFTARKEPRDSRCLKSRCGTEGWREEGEERRRCKKKEGNSRTFESGIRSGPEETRRNVIIAAKD